MDTLPFSNVEFSELSDTIMETEGEEDKDSKHNTLMRQIAQKKLKAKQRKAPVALKAQNSDSSAYDYSDSECEVTFKVNTARRRYGSADESPLAKRSRMGCSDNALPSTSKTSTPSHKDIPAARIASSPIPTVSRAQRDNEAEPQDFALPSESEAEDQYSGQSGDEADDEFMDDQSDNDEESEVDEEEGMPPLQPSDPRPLLNYEGDRAVQKDTQEGWCDPTVHVQDQAPPVPLFEERDAGELHFESENFKPIDYFYQMFPKALFDDIAAETNRYHGSGRHNRRHHK